MTTPENDGPLTGIEVRDRCPHCGDHQLVPRVQMAEHLARLHPEEPVVSGVQPDTRPVPCSLAVLHRPHGAHEWEPQPGMTPVNCPGFGPDESEEQRVDRLETEQEHAAGDHEHCDVTCEAKFPGDMLRNGILWRAAPGSAAMLDELLRRAGQPARPVPDTERRDRWDTAWPDPFGTLTAEQADTVRAMKAKLRTIADGEQRNLRRKLVAAESIRENADFHLGQQMARRQVAEKEVDRLRAELHEVRRVLRHYLEGARDRSAYFDEEGQRLSADNARLRAELEQARATPSHLWQVWCEDGPVHGFYATEDDAKQGSIDCWQETEPSCPDYSWAKDGPRLELLVGGVRGGVCISRQPVYGRHLTTAAPGGQAEDGAQPATTVDPDVVAYRNSHQPGVLLCRGHGFGWAGLTPLTSEDLPDGGTCTFGDPGDPDDRCGVDVLIPQPGPAVEDGAQQK